MCSGWRGIPSQPAQELASDPERKSTSEGSRHCTSEGSANPRLTLSTQVGVAGGLAEQERSPWRRAVVHAAIVRQAANSHVIPEAVSVLGGAHGRPLQVTVHLLGVWHVAGCRRTDYTDSCSVVHRDLNVGRGEALSAVCFRARFRRIFALTVGVLANDAAGLPGWTAG